MRLIEWPYRQGAGSGVMLTAMKLNTPAVQSAVMQTAFVRDRDD
jgi:hypothetical protein